MPELEPITREEMLLDGEDLTPITRKEKFIRRIYDNTQVIPEPITREEYFLKKAGEGGGGDVTIEQLNVSENGTYSESGKAYSPVVVTVPQPTLTTLTATENRTYTAPSGTAYNEVNVNVPLPANAYLKKSVSGLPQPIASFSDGADAPLKSLTASIVPVQAGSGDPSPTNVRPISGWSGANVYNDGANLFNQEYPNIDSTTRKLILNVGDGLFRMTTTTPLFTSSGGGTVASNLFLQTGEGEATASTQDDGVWLGHDKVVASTNGKVCIKYRIFNNISAYNPENFETELTKHTTTTIPFTDGQGQSVTVYGGSVDVVNGSGSAYKEYPSYNGETLIGPWISDRDVYAPNTTPTTGAQVVDMGDTTTFYTQPTSIKSLDGDNNVWASTGDVTELEYFSKEV